MPFEFPQPHICLCHAKLLCHGEKFSLWNSPPGLSSMLILSYFPNDLRVCHFLHQEQSPPSCSPSHAMLRQMNSPSELWTGLIMVPPAHQGGTAARRGLTQVNEPLARYSCSPPWWGKTLCSLPSGHIKMATIHLHHNSTQILSFQLNLNCSFWLSGEERGNWDFSEICCFDNYFHNNYWWIDLMWTRDIRVFCSGSLCYNEGQITNIPNN